MTTEFIIILVLLFVTAFTEVFIFLRNRKISKELRKIEEDAKYKMHEIRVLNELSEKTEYSLSIESVVETITKYLQDFVEYSSVSYMLVFPEKIILKSYTTAPISRTFLANVKEKMLVFLSETLKVDLSNLLLEEKQWGTVINEESGDKIGSILNVPLQISGKIIGLMTIADKKTRPFKKEEIDSIQRIVNQGTQALSHLQEVVESEKSKLNAMVASMTDGVVMVDMNNSVLVANPAIKKALGFEINYIPSLQELSEKLKDKFDLKDKVDEGIRLEKVFISEEFSLPIGFFKLIVSPVKDRWNMLGCVAVFRDMTKEKELERIKEDFTSMIVHELRSPLDSIKKMVEMMRGSKVEKKKQADCFQMIYSSSSDMLELVNNLLDMAKIEAGKFELRKEKSDIKKVIESRIMFFGTSAKDAKVNLLNIVDKNIPDMVEFDPHTISQVLNNLLSNAIKFTGENGNIIIQALLHQKGKKISDEAKEVGIEWFIDEDIEDIDNSLLVAVTDSGAGINTEQIGKLFNKFSQAKSMFVQKGGTGLGLAITKSIIESHGGIVGVSSIEGRGSTFYFTLPIENFPETK